MLTCPVCGKERQRKRTTCSLKCANESRRQAALHQNRDFDSSSVDEYALEWERRVAALVRAGKSRDWAEEMVAARMLEAAVERRPVTED